jgi:hypothetical protein
MDGLRRVIITQGSGLAGLQYMVVLQETLSKYKSFSTSLSPFVVTLQHHLAIMVKFVITALACAKLAIAACPYMDGDASTGATHHAPSRRDGAARTGSTSTNEFMAQFEVDDSNTYLTSNTGGPIEDQESLSAGERGPTLLEDFVFREKIMHFGKYEFSLWLSSTNKSCRP